MKNAVLASLVLAASILVAVGCTASGVGTSTEPSPDAAGRDAATRTNAAPPTVAIRGNATADLRAVPGEHRMELSLPLIIRPRVPSAGPDPSSADNALTAPPTADARWGKAPEGCAPDIAYRVDDALVVDGQPFAFFGVNAQYLLEPEFPLARIETELAALAKRNVNTVRIWYFYGHDPNRLQAILDAGARQGIRFVVALDDNVPRGPSWFFGDDDEEHYRPHVIRTVSRFSDRPEILMWEPTNEANCGDQYDDACVQTIKDWLSMSSQLIKEHDPCHLVSSGLIGAGNYERDHTAYRRLHQRDTLDVLSVHRGVDEDRKTEMATADELNAPIVHGEIYDVAYDEGCGLLEGGKVRNRRAERVKDDFRDVLRDGVDGYLLWDYAAGSIETAEGDARHYCGVYGYELTDPLWRVMAEAELPPPVPWR